MTVTQVFQFEINDKMLLYILLLLFYGMAWMESRILQIILNVAKQTRLEGLILIHMMSIALDASGGCGPCFMAPIRATCFPRDGPHNVRYMIIGQVHPIGLIQI